MYAILQMLVFDFGLFNTDVLLLKLNKYKDGILQEYYLTGKVGFFYRANSFGKYMVFSLMLILIFKSRYFQRKTIYYPLVFVVLLSVFLSVSRHSMVGMLVGLIYLFMVSVNKNKILKNGLVLMLFFAPIVYIFLYDRLMSYANILSVKSIVMDPSMQARFFSWSEIFSVIKSNPLGIGFGGHNHVSDNGYFAVALSSGLLGLAMFIYFIISVFKMSGRRKINYYSHEYHLYIQLYVVVFSVFNLASNVMVVSNIMLLIIFMAIADKIDYMSMARIREMEKVNG